jgi:C1A family cysteine protease
MQVQRYGWIRDIPDQRDLMFAPPPAVALQLPPSVDLTGGFPDCYDQGQIGSCTANAIAGALQFLEKKEGAAAPVMPSRLFIYYNERTLEGTTASDSGAQIRDGIKSVVKQGFCPEAEWPYDVSKFAQQPSAQCYQDALKERVGSYLRLSPIESILLSCLASGYPFVFGFSVYEGFESPQVAQSGVANIPGRGERLIGGHAVVAAGYDQAARRFRVRNSWGPSWGQNGYFTLPFEYLTSPMLASDFWTIRQVPVA